MAVLAEAEFERLVEAVASRVVQKIEMDLIKKEYDRLVSELDQTDMDIINRNPAIQY